MQETKSTMGEIGQEIQFLTSLAEETTDAIGRLQEALYPAMRDEPPEVGGDKETALDRSSPIAVQLQAINEQIGRDLKRIRSLSMRLEL